MKYEQHRKEAILRLQARLNKRRRLRRLPESERRIPRLDLGGLTVDEWLITVCEVEGE